LKIDDLRLKIILITNQLY